MVECSSKTGQKVKFPPNKPSVGLLVEKTKKNQRHEQSSSSRLSPFSFLLTLNPHPWAGRQRGGVAGGGWPGGPQLAWISG
jgi:hypothetical protein